MNQAMARQFCSPANMMMECHVDIKQQKALAIG